MMAEGSLTIQAGNEIHNDYSTMAAAGNLSVTAGRDIENTGYQGTIHYDYQGHDNHYWKYKKHTRIHLHCHMVCGGFSIPDDPQYTDKIRLVIVGIGTPQIGGDISYSDDLLRNQYEQRKIESEENKYGAD